MAAFLATPLFLAAPSLHAQTYRTVRVVDTVVSNTDPNLKNTDAWGDEETSLAINPSNPNEIVAVGFAQSFDGSNGNGALFRSTDSGATWTKSLSIPQPPGTTGFSLADQSLDWGRNNRLSMTFLLENSSFETNIASAVVTNPASASSFIYNVAGGNVQLTNHLVTGSLLDVDQPWLLVNRDTSLAGQDNTYVAYDDFSNSDGVDGPDMRVAVSYGVTPLNFTVDVQVGNSTGPINPGLRLAKDPTTGILYALWQRCTANCGTSTQVISYMLNRSVDGGHTWALNGSSLGIAVATGTSVQPTPNFGTVNALLGGVLHAAVDPRNGAVYYVYGTADSSGRRSVALRRITVNGTGNASIGNETVIAGGEAAIPQVAVDTSGTVGVFYYRFDGTSPAPANRPLFSTHFAVSVNQGAFVDRTLASFQAPETDNGNSRQRVFGDYMNLKVAGTCFKGVFNANGTAFGRTTDNDDPVYYEICQDLAPPTCVLGTGGVTVGVDLADRTVINGPVAAGTFLQLGSHGTINGNAVASGNAFFRESATINGNLTLSGAFQHQTVWTVNGTLTEHATVTIPTLTTHTVATNGTPVTVNGGASGTVTPGTYGALTAYASARVTLQPGTYNFSSFDLEPGVTLIVTGATTVNVAGSTIWSDRVVVQTSASHLLTLYTNATSLRVGTDGIFDGFLLAPNAGLSVSSRTQFRGCLGGKTVVFEPDVTLTSAGATLSL